MATLEELKKSEIESKIGLNDAKKNAFEKKIEESPKGTPWHDRLQALLTIITILGGIVTLWIKSDQYISQQKTQYDRNLNQQMVEFVNDLTSDNDEKRDLALMMLSYFEFDAIPIYLYKLERSSHENAFAVTLMIKNILSTDAMRAKESTDLIIKYTSDLFVKELNKNMEELQIDALLNFLLLLREIEVRDQQLFENLSDRLNQYHDDEASPVEIDDLKALIEPLLIL